MERESISWSDLLEQFQTEMSAFATWAFNTFFDIIDIFTKLFTAGCEFVYDTLMGMITRVLDVKSYIPNAEVIIDGIADMASIILVIIFLKNIFTNYILDIDGEAEEDPIHMLIKVAFALAVVNCSEIIHSTLMEIESLITIYLDTLVVSATYKQSGNLLELLWNVIEGMMSATEMVAIVVNPITATAVGLIMLIWIIVFLILIIILACKILFRSVELFIFECLMPVFACDLVSTKKELWKPFFRSYLTTVFGLTIQNFCLGLSLVILASPLSSEPGLAIKLLTPIISTLFLYFGCKAPKWLSAFTYQTSGTGALGSGLKGVASGASQAISLVGLLK